MDIAMLQAISNSFEKDIKHFASAERSSTNPYNKVIGQTTVIILTSMNDAVKAAIKTQEAKVSNQ